MSVSMSSCLKKTDVMTSATCSHRFCDAFVSLRGSLGRPVWCSFPPAGDGKVEVANVGILGSGCASGCETSVPGMMEQGWKRDGSEAQVCSVSSSHVLPSPAFWERVPPPFGAKPFFSAARRSSKWRSSMAAVPTMTVLQLPPGPNVQWTCLEDRSQ